MENIVNSEGANNPTTLLSLLGTQPSFPQTIDAVMSMEATPLFIKELTKNLDCMKSIAPMISEHKDEFQMIAKNFGLNETFTNTLQVVAEEMNLTYQDQAPNQSLEDKIQQRNQNKSKLTI